MSARIRHSSLLLRKYDWSFCECINVQRRGLNINRVVSKNHKPKANSTPELNRVAVDPTSAKPLGTRLDAVLSSTLSASTLRVATAQGKPTKRKRSQGLRILRKVPTGPSNGIRIIRVTTDVPTGPKPLVRRANSTKRPRGLIIKAQSKSTEPTATGLLSSETGTQYTISRRYKKRTHWTTSAEERLRDLTSAERVMPKSVNKQSQTVRFPKVPADSNLSIEHAREQAFHKMNFNRLEDRSRVRRVSLLSITKTYPPAPERPIPKRRLRRIKPPRIRKLVRRVSLLSITKTYPGAPERPIPRGRLRRIKFLRIRKFLSTPATEQPIVSEKAREMAQELYRSRLESIAATQPEVFPSRVLSPAEVKIIKFDSLRVRKHVITVQKFRKVNEHVKVRKVNTSIDIGEQTAQQPEQEVKDGRDIGFEGVPKGVQPLVIKRPRNIVVQKVPTSPNQPVEPQTRVQDSPLIRRFVSSSVYPIPTEETKNLAALAPERDSMEQPEPTNIEHWNPSARIERAIESAAAKRLQRHSWLTRKGDVRLAISLLFSPRSLKDVERLRRMYNPNKGEFRRFKIFRRLEVGNYTEYNRMLASFAQSWTPFDMKLNKPVHFTKKSRYRVGFQLDFEKIEQLERNLFGSVKSLPCAANVGWSNLRDNDEHSVMVINEHIKEAEEAIHLMELLDLEHKLGLPNIRVEGLVLHGYLPGEDSLFPPPEEFRFPGTERRIARIPAGFSQVVRQLEI